MTDAPQATLTDLQRTAIAAAALRAAHALAGEEPRIFEDEFALGLSGLSAEQVLAMAERVPAESASTCVLRSRFTEDRLAATCDVVDQYVILGAGLDSYALRNAVERDGVMVFEVDDPSFLEWKRDRIAALGRDLPARLRFAPCDFEQTNLEDALSAAGFDSAAPCFVSMLGVTQYLTIAAIEETLGWAGSRPSGSQIVLSFLERNEGSAGLKESMAATGVTVHSSFSESEMSELLVAAGFGKVEHLSRERAHREFFAGRTDGLIVPGMQRLVAATV